MRQQQQQTQREYLPGATVFAKLKGYPWWPARIESDQAVPATVLNQRTKTKGTVYTVLFYGTKDYGFFGPDAIRPFDHANVANDLEANKFKTKDLEAAVRHALSLNQDEKKGTKRKTRRLVQQEVDETEIKRRRKSISVEKEVDFKQTEEYKNMYLTRHRLQRLVYNKIEGEIPKDDYPKILQLVKDIEDTPMTYNLLKVKETKIGKVVKAACTYPFIDDGSDIKNRCQRLMKNWKSFIIEPHSNSSFSTP